MADLRKEGDLAAQVLERVRSRTPNGNNYQVVNVQDRFLNGSLFTVAFEIPGADGVVASYFNRVYVTKRAITVYGHDNELLSIVGEVHSRSFYDFFANGDVVSGIIALLVTIMIVPSFLASYWTGTEITVPAWITSGWLLILGFYFGKASSRAE